MSAALPANVHGVGIGEGELVWGRLDPPLVVGYTKYIKTKNEWKAEKDQTKVVEEEQEPLN